MKTIQTSIIAGLAFFLSAGISFGAELDDLDVTIRMVKSDDLTEMHNELSLPAVVSDAAQEHAEDGDNGLARANEVRNHGQESETENEQEDSAEARDEREDEVEDHDEAREDKGDVDDERDDSTEEAGHQEDHENARPEGPVGMS